MYVAKITRSTVEYPLAYKMSWANGFLLQPS